MILADTNIIIDFWKYPIPEKREIFERQEIAICPVVKVELIHGARSDKEKRKISEALSGLVLLPIDDEVWNLVGDSLFTLKKVGITVPFQDILIACVAIKFDCQLWTRDKHFFKIRDHIETLELFTD